MPSEEDRSPHKMTVEASSSSSKWREEVGIYVGGLSFLIAAFSRFTALEVFVAVVTLYSILLVLLLLFAEARVQSLVSGAAIQYSLLSALAMPFFGAFQPGFFAFIGLYSIAWWVFLFFVIEMERRISPRGEIDNAGPAVLGMVWLMSILIGGAVRGVWSFVSQ